MGRLGRCPICCRASCYLRRTAACERGLAVKIGDVEPFVAEQGRGALRAFEKTRAISSSLCGAGRRSDEIHGDKNAIGEEVGHAL